MGEPGGAQRGQVDRGLALLGERRSANDQQPNAGEKGTNHIRDSRSKRSLDPSGRCGAATPAHMLEPAQTRVSEGAHMAVRLRASRRSQPARSQGKTAAAIIHPTIGATRRLRRYRRSFNCGKVARDADIKYA